MSMLKKVLVSAPLLASSAMKSKSFIGYTSLQSSMYRKMSSGPSTATKAPVGSNLNVVPPQFIEESEKLITSKFEELFSEKKKQGPSTPIVKSVPRKELKRVHYQEYQKKSEADKVAQSELDQIRDRIGFSSAYTKLAYLLYSSYKKANQLKNVEPDITKLTQAIKSNPELGKLMTTDNMKESVRLERFLKLMETVKISPKMDAWLKTVALSKCLKYLPYIAEEYAEIKDAIEVKSVFATIVTAKELPANELAELTEGLKKQFKNEKVSVSTKIDPSVVDGYEIFYDDKYYLDNTERTRISRLKTAVQSSINSYFSNIEAETKIRIDEASQSSTPLQLQKKFFYSLSYDEMI